MKWRKEGKSIKKRKVGTIFQFPVRQKRKRQEDKEELAASREVKRRR